MLAGFLLALSLAGTAIIYLATYRFGPGVSGDAVQNLAAAANLLQGRGLMNVYGHEMAQWPPLYAWLLAALRLVTGSDVVQVAWHLNAIVFGASIFCSGLLFRRTFPDTQVFAYIGAAVVATCLGIIQISANVASDPLLLLFTILFLIFAGRYGEGRKRADLIWMGVFAILGSYQRYAGLALIAAGAGALAYMNRRQVARALAQGGAFFLVTAAPIFAWGLLHNMPASGQLFGTYLQPSVLGNLNAAAVKFLYWFIPDSVIQRATPYAILAVLLAALLLLNRGGDWGRWFRLITSDGQIASTIFFIVYAGLLVGYVSYSEHRNLASQRIHMVILPSLLILIFSSIRELVPPRLDSPLGQHKYRALAVLAILWVVYPVAKVWNYLRESDGVESSGTNLFNTAAIHEGSFLQEAEALPASGKMIYSNYEEPAWLYLRTGIGSVPRLEERTLDAEGQARLRASVAANGEAYLVWFNTVHLRDNMPKPEQLLSVVKMEPVLLSEAGNIYLIRPAGP